MTDYSDDVKKPAPIREAAANRTLELYATMSGAEFQRAVRDDPDKWADAAMAAAEDLGYKIERDWIRSLLADAMDAARRTSIRKVVG